MIVDVDLPQPGESPASMYSLACYSPMSLDVSELVKHQRLIDGLHAAPEPWRARQQFKPLKTGGDVVSFIARRRDLPPWIDHFWANYCGRTPGALEYPDRFKDRLLIEVDPSVMPEPVWIDGLMQVLFGCFEPSAMTVSNSLGFFRQREEMRRKIVIGSATHPITAKWSHYFNIKHMPQILYLSHSACRETTGVSSEHLSSYLIDHGVAVDRSDRGILIRGADRYLKPSEFIALSDRLTTLVKEAIVAGGGTVG